MGKTRIVETHDDRFMPQFKVGLLSGWKFFRKDADQGVCLLVHTLQENDPARAATFRTEAEAIAFLERFWIRVRSYWQDRREAKAREDAGVAIKRIIE